MPSWLSFASSQYYLPDGRKALMNQREAHQPDEKKFILLTECTIMDLRSGSLLRLPRLCDLADWLQICP